MNVIISTVFVGGNGFSQRLGLQVLHLGKELSASVDERFGSRILLEIDFGIVCSCVHCDCS